LQRKTCLLAQIHFDQKSTSQDNWYKKGIDNNSQ